MVTTIIIILGLASLLILLSPFFTKKNEKQEINDQDDQQEKELVFSQLADLEYDFQMEKISNEDFDKTKLELSLKAKRFVGSKKNKDQIELMVDTEIHDYLIKQGLKSDVEVGYE